MVQWKILLRVFYHRGKKTNASVLDIPGNQCALSPYVSPMDSGRGSRMGLEVWCPPPDTPTLGLRACPFPSVGEAPRQNRVVRSPDNRHVVIYPGGAP